MKWGSMLAFDIDKDQLRKSKTHIFVKRECFSPAPKGHHLQLEMIR